ncbi:hypothetical protein NE237_032797 [Protea cynaroides]|uniref:F-box/kelch-repeat protein n=1 Tax=Protea cynaroides TaxID=273540 RepID=A0A9Q0R3W8_9MAGN|nr:hypothetical protein NE237_032797 [Protea cynaroides]
MNHPCCLFGSSSYGEIVIVAGVNDKSGHLLKSTELYHSKLGAWKSLPVMNLPHIMCSGFFMDGKYYVIGGISGLAERWRRSPPLIAVVNNQRYAADLTTNEVNKYDKSNNTWNFVKRLPVRDDSNNKWGLAFKACGDKLLVVGGHRRTDGEVIVLHSWRPEDGNGEGPEWDVLSIRERAGGFVYNCAVMGC